MADELHEGYDIAGGERRKHRRFKLNDTAFALLQNGSGVGMGQIADISRSGLSYIYFVGKSPAIKSSKLDILFSDSNYRITQIPFRMITDHPTSNESTLNPIGQRRCGVQFVGLTPDHDRKLDYVLENFT